MNKLVVYQSETGFTRLYAQWIAEALGCPARPAGEVTEAELAGTGLIIFGGWLMGSRIMGLEKIRRAAPQRLVVFAVGITPAGPETAEQTRRQNHLGALPFFYLEGGLRKERLGLIKRAMLGMVKTSLARKGEKSAQDLLLLSRLDASCDCTDRQSLQPLLDSVGGI